MIWYVRCEGFLLTNDRDEKFEGLCLYLCGIK